MLRKLILEHLLKNLRFFFYLTDPAVITHISGNQTVNESDTVNLTSAADGTPEPNITWTRLSDNSVVTFPLTITGKQNEGGYRCTADNGVGSPDKRTVFIFVESEFSVHSFYSKPDVLLCMSS